MPQVDLEYVNELVYPDYFQPRQFDVLKLKLLGYTGQQMGKELNIGKETARARWQEVRQILGIVGQGGQRRLMRWAIENHLIEVRF